MQSVSVYAPAASPGGRHHSAGVATPLKTKKGWSAPIGAPFFFDHWAGQGARATTTSRSPAVFPKARYCSRKSSGGKRRKVRNASSRGSPGQGCAGPGWPGCKKGHGGQGRRPHPGIHSGPIPPRSAPESRAGPPTSIPRSGKSVRSPDRDNNPKRCRCWPNNCRGQFARSRPSRNGQWVCQSNRPAAGFVR